MTRRFHIKAVDVNISVLNMNWLHAQYLWLF
jgi:hypothetical protein